MLVSYLIGCIGKHAYERIDIGKETHLNIIHVITISQLITLTILIHFKLKYNKNFNTQTLQ